ncbi:MAG: hypothetical protein ACQEQJ_02075 [Halobacteriota archaeon]|uniref:hypothetical protein n=1 Tax=Halodesulfurarchaeum sp. HSR-GB TaxID=3074077 RepID=UPI0028587BB0|nr:hypothetical protein [Halodesulfurarchaeum sp. HSR-GB]MDR5656177.1 hypothetical protein [Halodesulfurarchaeum sp. HSR-GB]
MNELVADFAGELVSLLAVAIGSTLFTALGLLGEQAALSNVMAGSLALGAWELFIGAWALFVGVYLLGIKQLVPRARALLA